MTRKRAVNLLNHLTEINFLGIGGILQTITDSIMVREGQAAGWKAANIYQEIKETQGETNGWIFFDAIYPIIRDISDVED